MVAHISPRLRKSGLNPRDPASYRPISSFNSIGNVLEWLFLARLVLRVSGLYCPLLSVNRCHHSTEKVLLKISNDIFEAANARKVLVALNLSAAFDTIDHSVVISRLEHTLGLVGLAFIWLRSYLSDRTSFVKIERDLGRLL